MTIPATPTRPIQVDGAVAGTSVTLGLFDPSDPDERDSFFFPGTGCNPTSDVGQNPGAAPVRASFPDGGKAGREHLEEQAFQAVAQMSWAHFARFTPGAVDIRTAADNPKRQLFEHLLCRADGQMDSVICKRGDLAGQSKAVPQAVGHGAVMIDRVVHVNGEVERGLLASARGDLRKDLARIGGMVDHIVAKDDVDLGVVERQVLPAGRDRRYLRSALPRE